MRYYIISPGNIDVTPNLGPEVARVKFNDSRNVCDLNYQLKDGDATFLAEGTPIHSIVGYHSAKVLAASGLVFEARPEGGVVGADQLTFTTGVHRIAILSQIDGKTELGRVEEPALVNAFVEAALQAPIEVRRVETGTTYSSSSLKTSYGS